MMGLLQGVSRSFATEISDGILTRGVAEWFQSGGVGLSREWIIE
jgi:hypothetical protein